MSGEFIITGLENAIKPLSQACGWNDETNITAPSSEPKAPSSTQAGATTKYVLQVGSKLNQTEALLTFADMQQRYPKLLAGLRPMVQKADLGSKGVWYRLRIGPISNKEAATRLCGQLTARGHPDCLVMAAK